MLKNKEAELIEELKSGSETALRMVIKENKSRVAAVVKGMLGDTQEAEDIGQEVFIRFYKSISNFRGESSISTYLTRIAINLSLNEIKRRKRREIFSLDKVKTMLSKDKITDNFEKKEIVNKALLKLDEKFRAVLILRIMENYSTEETAKILNIPVGTVLSRLARGQKKLKELLTPHMEGI